MAIYDTVSSRTGGGTSGKFVRLFAVGLGGIALVFILSMLGSIGENVDASEIVLVQSISGELTWHTTPGWICQCFGKVTSYPKRGVLEFKGDKAAPIAFNDNGRAKLIGSMNFELPLDTQHLTDMHSAYPTSESLQEGLIKPAMNKSIFLTGTLMSSFESYKEKRSMLIQYVEDQAQRGVYRTRTAEREVDEEVIGPDGQPTTRKKKITEVNIVTNDQGQVVRNEEGQLERFGVKAFNFAIEDIDYDDVVDKQIASQQEITMSVETSIANAKKAQQDAVTAEAQGRANVATARAKEEIDKTVAIVQGEKARDVANLKAQEAEAYKKEQLLRADADSEYRRRMMVSDGALAQKLDAIKAINATWANAFANAKTPLVPSVVMGNSSGSNAGSTAQTFMDILTISAAKQLGVELSPKQ